MAAKTKAGKKLPGIKISAKRSVKKVEDKARASSAAKKAALGKPPAAGKISKVGHSSKVGKISDVGKAPRAAKVDASKAGKHPLVKATKKATVTTHSKTQTTAKAASPIKAAVKLARHGKANAAVANPGVHANSATHSKPAVHKAKNAAHTIIARKAGVQSKPVAAKPVAKIVPAKDEALRKPAPLPEKVIAKLVPAAAHAKPAPAKPVATLVKSVPAAAHAKPVVAPVKAVATPAKPATVPAKPVVEAVKPAIVTVAPKAPGVKTMISKETLRAAALKTGAAGPAPLKVVPLAPRIEAARPGVPAGALAQRPHSAGVVVPVKAAVPLPVVARPTAPAAGGEAADALKKKAAVKLNQKHGFRTSEYIVYPTHGVGKIVGIEEQVVAGHSLELFVINFEHEKMTLRVPTAKLAAVGMRKLSEEPIVTRAMDTLKGRARVKRTMWSRRAQEYEQKINSGDLVSIAEVVRDLFRAETQPEQSYSERQLFEAALDRMAREIAAVEKLDDRGAVQKVLDVLSRSARGRRAAEEAAAAANATAAASTAATG